MSRSIPFSYTRRRSMAGQPTVSMKSIPEFFAVWSPSQGMGQPAASSKSDRQRPAQESFQLLLQPADFDRVRSQLHPRSRVQDHVHERPFRVDS